MFVDSGIQHAELTCHIVINGLPRSAILFHTIPQTARFLDKKVTEQEMGFDILHNFVSNISRSKKI